jgi:amidase
MREFVAEHAPRPARGLRVAVHGDVPEEVRAAFVAAGAQLTDADVLEVEESRDITQRYWRRSTLSGPEVDAMLADWDRSRSRAMRRLEMFDAIVSLAAPHPAPPIGVESIEDWTFMLGPSLWGWPAVVVPATTSPEGLPMGVQIVAGPWKEETCLALGEPLRR